MEKINFQNGQAPAINDTNLNQLQANVENAIETAKTNLEEEIETVKTTRDLEDITSQVTFNNCTLTAGKIMVDRKNRILYFQIAILPTVTSDWKQVMVLPSDINILDIQDGGVPLGSAPFWVYNYKHEIVGSITKDSKLFITEMLLLQ